jgi:hypothetical protein
MRYVTADFRLDWSAINSRSLSHFGTFLSRPDSFKPLDGKEAMLGWKRLKQRWGLTIEN